jgi:hypothetical protein
MKYIGLLLVLTMSGLASWADEREPDRFEQAIIAHNTMVVGSVRSVNENSKSAMEATGMVTIQIQEKLQGDIDSEILQLPFEYLDPTVRSKFARTGWGRVLPRQGRRVLVAFSCNSRNQCDATAVLDLDVPGEAKWLDPIRQALTLTNGANSDKGKQRLLQALSSDNSLLRQVSHDTLLGVCKSEWCRAEMVDKEIAATRLSDTVRQSEALNQLAEIYDRLKPGSIYRQHILKRWFEMISDEAHGNYVIELLHTKLADPMNKTATPLADLGGFSVREKQSFISVLNAVPLKDRPGQEVQSLIKMLRRTTKDGDSTRKEHSSTVDSSSQVRGRSDKKE